MKKQNSHGSIQEYTFMYTEIRGLNKVPMVLCCIMDNVQNGWVDLSLALCLVNLVIILSLICKETVDKENSYSERKENTIPSKVF